MTKKRFLLLASLLAGCAILSTAAFAVQESSWFRTDVSARIVLARPQEADALAAPFDASICLPETP